jgi:hypothetical protein
MVGGDGMERKAIDVNQGDLLATKTVFMDSESRRAGEQESERS